MSRRRISSLNMITTKNVNEEEKKETKKETKKKSKMINYSSNAYSNIYPKYFNNKNFSDFKITIDNDTILSHKFILASNSTFFENYDGNEFTFPKEDDQEAAKSLIKYYYEGKYEYTDDSKVLIFSILANKVYLLILLYLFSIKLKILMVLSIFLILEFKLPAKLMLNGVITYVEKDLNNRFSEFDSLCDSINFKKVDKELLLKLYSKKKWFKFIFN
jgi:hypothetical protein